MSIKYDIFLPMKFLKDKYDKKINRKSIISQQQSPFLCGFGP